MRRHDTSSVGKQAEDLAARLLEQHGFAVRNLNDDRVNTPIYDLVVARDGASVEVSVKCARAKRELRLGSPRVLKRLPDDCVVMAFLPALKGHEIDLQPGGYELLILPGDVVREEGLAVHNHYVAAHPGSADHSVMVKDKVDSNPGTISGTAFKRWRENYLNAWDTFEAVLDMKRSGAA